MNHLRITCSAGLLALATGCGGSGDLTVTTYGEDFIEVGIPAASEAEPEGFVDGWTVRYDRFLVVLADLEVGDEDGPVLEDPAARVFDLTAPGPHEVRIATGLPSGTFDELGVATRPDAAPEAGNADADAVAQVADGGWSVFASGTAEKAGETKTFAWGFQTATRFAGCEDADAKAGVVIPNGGRARVELTIHGDHLFYDDLLADDAVLRFDAIAAADADDDGEVTLAELAAVDLTSLPPDQYGTGGDGRVQDLAAFVRDQTRSLVHFQGEGHCQAEVLGR